MKRMLHMGKDIAVYKNTTGIVEIMQNLFAAENLHMYQVDELDELIRLGKTRNIHLILVDVKLDGSGLGNEFELIRCIRDFTNVPIIVVSPQTSEIAQIATLNLGADDYIALSDNPMVILARIKAQLRRYTELSDVVNHKEIYRTEHIEVNEQNHTVTVDGRNVKMTPIEYQILRLLVKEKGKVLSIEQIYQSIWNMKPHEAGNVVAVHIRHIREKIEKNPKEPQYIKAVWGLGYKAM